MRVIIPFEKILSSRMLSKKLEVNTYIIIILPVVLYCCETWSLIFREELKLRVFENKVLRKILGAKREKLQENSESYTMLSYMHRNLRLT